jgi:hypothetical protein
MKSQLCVFRTRFIVFFLTFSYNSVNHIATKPIAMTERSKARSVFVHSNTEVVRSNPTRGMSVCVCESCVYVVLYVLCR